MAGTEERFDRMEHRLDGVERELTGLRGEVQKWRVLQEAQGDQTRIIAEVQAHHGERLDRIDARFDQVDRRFDQIDRRFAEMDKRFGEIGKALQPLAALDEFVRAVAGDHEHRIAALERGREQ